MAKSLPGNVADRRRYAALSKQYAALYLAAAATGRDRTFLTNAVKRFKFTLRGSGEYTAADHRRIVYYRW